ncbi:MAG: type I restriction enzyme S subunit [Alteromonadaceae bacterium]|jgi:type I restriction enzyme S subunit
MIASHRFPMYQPKNNLCDISFILYLFKTKFGKHLLGLASPGGAGRNKTLGQSEFARIKLALPPLTEQKKITKILSTWDKAIAVNEQILVNFQQQKKALMQQLLDGSKRLPGFNEERQYTNLANICIINPTKPVGPLNSTVTFIPMNAVSEDAKQLRFITEQYAIVEKGFTSFINHDVLVAKITPCFEHGKGLYAENLINGIGFGSTEFHVLRAKAKNGTDQTG